MSVKIDQTCKHKHHPIFKIYLYTNTNIKVFQDRKTNKICKTLAIESDKIIFAKTIDIRFFGVYNADKFTRNGAKIMLCKTNATAYEFFYFYFYFAEK